MYKFKFDSAALRTYAIDVRTRANTHAQARTEGRGVCCSKYENAGNIGMVLT